MRRQVRSRAVRIAIAGVLLLAASPGAAHAAGSGSVSATVTGAAPCLTVSGSFAYGTLPFSQVNSISEANSGSTATVTNCGAQGETVLAHLSSATNGNTTWTVTTGDPCANNGTNAFGMDVFDSPNANTRLRLSGLDQTFLANVAASAQQAVSGTIYMPCTGSTGAGLVMTSTITLTATF